MLCNISDIRSRLGDMMSNVLTGDVAHTYADYVTKLKTSPETIINRCARQTDDLIQTLSHYLNNPKRIASLMQITTPDVVFTFFVRYHLLTQYLACHVQGAPANVPDDDKTFFVVMMTKFWRFALS